MIGSTFGHFRITAPIGAGGMGEVFRARDGRLDRDVAIKVLPEHITRDADRLVRFDREAKLLASFSHPNIATLHGLEEYEGRRFLVMELVEGETLAARLLKGPIALQDAFDLATQIAVGLEAAHHRCIIHRDLKPANVMIAANGAVKILDFGIAKMGPEEIDSAELMHSPTITEGLTARGVVLGTAAYMSPEQARGQRLDRRSDIWSFGVVLYEMVTGSNPLVAYSAAETVGNVLNREIDFGLLPRLPANIRRVFKRCLERDLEMRYHDIADVRIELEHPEDDEPQAEVHLHRPLRPWLRAALVAGLLFVGAGLGWLVEGRGSVTGSGCRRAPGIPELEAEISAPDGHRLSGLSQPNFSLSPNGEYLAFFTGPEPEGLWGVRWPRPTQLVLRRLSHSQGVPVVGVDHGTSPVFSPDGRWIAYIDDALYKIPISGGQRIKINSDGDLTFRTVLGLSWGKNGDLVLGMRDGGLQRVSEGAGLPENLTELDEELGEFRHGLPAHLPDGQTILFTAFRHHVSNPEPNALSIWAFRTGTKERIWLIDNASQARSSGNQLLFMREGDLMAVPFDPSKLVLGGSPRQLKPNVLHALHTDFTYTSTAVGHYDVARNGTLVFASGGINEKLPNHVLWIDRSGVSTPVDVEARHYKSVRVAPDGSSLLLWQQNPGNDAIWNLDLRRGSGRRELGGGNFLWFTWGPQAGQMTGTRYVETGTEIVTARVGADSGRTAVVPFSKPVLLAAEWSRDGQSLVCAQTHDLWLCRTGGECRHIPRPGGVRERYPAISPDGRWLAYSSDESSRAEVYVRSLNDLEIVHHVSFKGGTESAWSHDGSELFFVGEENMNAVAIEEGEDGRLLIGEPRLLFHLGVFMNTIPIRSWDVAPDGRFVFIKPISDEERTVMRKKRCPDRIHILQNWPARLVQ